MKTNRLITLKLNEMSFSGAKTLFSIVCLIVTLVVHAAPTTPAIGTTQLLYKDSLAIDSILNKIATNKSAGGLQKFKLNDKIMQSVAKQMPRFQNLLNTALIEHSNFTVFDAESDLMALKSRDPGFLRMVYKTTEVEPPPVVKPEVKTLMGKYATSIPNTQPGKLILIGWVENITDNKSKDVIFDTNKISFIFSVDINTEYRLINTRTNKVVATYTAVGHGGIARILPSLNETIIYDVDSMVSDMFASLAKNVRHGLALKQQQFIKEKIQSANAAKTASEKR